MVFDKRPVPSLPALGWRGHEFRPVCFTAVFTKPQPVFECLSTVCPGTNGPPSPPPTHPPPRLSLLSLNNDVSLMMIVLLLFLQKQSLVVLRTAVASSSEIPLQPLIVGGRNFWSEQAGRRGSARLEPFLGFFEILRNNPRKVIILLKRVLIPNRYTAKAKLCFCKYNKRRIIARWRCTEALVLGPLNSLVC